MPLYCEIILQETLDERWALWIEGMNLCSPQSGGTLLQGTLPDKAALHSLLARIYDLNLTLVALRRNEPMQKNIEKEGK